MCQWFFQAAATFYLEPYNMQNYVFLRSSRCHLFKSGLKNVIRCFMNKLTPFKEKFFFECTICSNKGNFWYKVQNIEKSSGIERPWSDLSESAIKNCFRTKVFGDLTNFCVGIENHKIIFLSWKSYFYLENTHGITF